MNKRCYKDYQRTDGRTSSVLYFKANALLILIIFMSSQLNAINLKEEPHHCFFKKNSVTIGLGGSLALNQNATGINARVYYNLKEHLCFGPEASYIQKGSLSITDFNLVGHYIFDIKHLGFYPLIGANYTTEEDHNQRHEAFGLLIGAGLHRNFRNLTLFTEYTHVESNLKDAYITAGLMYSIH